MFYTRVHDNNKDFPMPIMFEYAMSVVFVHNNFIVRTYETFASVVYENVRNIEDVGRLSFESFYALTHVNQGPKPFRTLYFYLITILDSVTFFYSIVPLRNTRYFSFRIQLS